MRLDLRRDALLIIPESDQDRAYIEDTLKLSTSGATIPLARVDDISLGYAKGDAFVLKAGIAKGSA